MTFLPARSGLGGVEAGHWPEVGVAAAYAYPRRPGVDDGKKPTQGRAVHVRNMTWKQRLISPNVQCAPDLRIRHPFGHGAKSLLVGDDLD
jgi:hypothetical protein